MKQKMKARWIKYSAVSFMEMKSHNVLIIRYHFFKKTKHLRFRTSRGGLGGGGFGGRTRFLLIGFLEIKQHLLLLLQVKLLLTDLLLLEHDLLLLDAL